MSRYLLVVMTLLAGCASRPVPPPITGEPIGLQILRAAPSLAQMRFNVLLDFESPSDRVFIISDSKQFTEQIGGGHTGVSSLSIPAGTQIIAVKLPLLLGQRAFPGEWALLGAYIHSPYAGQVEVAYEVSGEVVARRSVVLGADTWTPVMLDIGRTSDPNHPPVAGEIGMLTFDFLGPIEPGVRIDDVLLIDNARSLVSGRSAGTWSIRRKGFRIFGDQPGRFSFTLDTPEASPNGWVVEEANELRARFSSNGQPRSLTVYADGRAYWDAVFKPMSALLDVAQLARQHDSPAELSIPETLGRLNRNTPGDANNDAYNEARGAYQIVATGPRLEARLTPRTPALVRPVLEISGMPDGKPLVTIEGQLVDHAVRLPDGALLIELPVRIQRGATVNVRVQ